MKRLSKLMLFFMMISIVVSCRKDEITNDEEIIIITTNEEGEVGLQGHITDESKLSIPGAEVTVGDQTVFTDEYGFFIIDNANVVNGTVVITIEKENYISSFRKVLISSTQKETFIRSSLISKEGHDHTFDASDGGTIVGNGTHSISFDPNSIVSESGESYDSTVIFTSYFIDPTRLDLVDIMPGDLSAINTQGDEVQLVSFGMLYGDLVSSTGAPLQIKEGYTATVKIPIASENLQDAPNQIPLWSLNEETATWIEEGVAVKQGDNYIAKVSHFSFWNCDAPYPIVDAYGCVVDHNGVPLINTSIFVTVPSMGITRYCTTDREGCFYGKFPKDEDLLIGVFNSCDHETVLPFGPFNSSTNVGTLEFDLSEYVILIDGKLEDCSMEAVYPGIVQVVKNNNQELVIQTDEQGVFSFSYFTCGESTVEIKGIDPIELIESDINNYNINDFMSVGTLSVCDEQLSRYVRFTFDQSLNLFTDISANRIGDKLQLNGSNVDYSFVMEIVESDITNPMKSLTVFNADGSAFLFWDEDSNDELNFSFDATGGVGEEVEGSFNGEHLGVSVLCEYKLEVGNELTPISGMVWDDINQNGIRESDELPVEGVRIDIDEASTNINTQTFTNENGMYTLYGTHLNVNLLTITLPDDYFLTDQSVGANNAIDSDYDQNSGIVSVNISNPGIAIENIDAGIHISAAVYCDVTTVSDPCDTGNGDICQLVSSNVSGLNFSNVILENNGTIIFESGPSTSAVELCGLSFDTYRIIAVMENGVECIHNLSLDGPPIDDMLFQVSILSCDPLDAIVTAIPEKLESTELDFEWSNGTLDQTTMMSEGESLSLTATNFLGCEYPYEYTLEKRNLLISGVAWIDDSSGIDNIRDSNDTERFGSLWFTIYSIDGTKVDEFKTGNSAIYQFYIDVPPGDYYIEIGDFSSLYELVVPFQGSDDTRDSDFDQSTKRSNIFTVTGDDCQSIQNLDVGITLI